MSKFFRHKDGVRLYIVEDGDDIDVEDVVEMSDDQVKSAREKWGIENPKQHFSENPYGFDEPKDISKGGIFKEDNGALVRVDS